VFLAVLRFSLPIFLLLLRGFRILHAWRPGGRNHAEGFLGVQMKRCNLAALLLLSLSLILLSCGTGHDADEKYVLVSANLQVPYWQTAKAGFLQAASQIRVRAEVAGPDNYDPKAEAQALREAVQGKATGILVSVTDANLIKPEIDSAIAAGVPVITVDSDAPESKRLFFIGTDNYHAGVIGGQRLAKELQGKGDVVVFTMPEQSNLKDRLRGYRDALQAYPQIKIVRIVDIKGDSRIAFDTAGQILGNDKKEPVNAFVCLEALAGKEVATVLSNNNIKGKVVIAMDTDPDTLEWIQKGWIAATISQKPYSMAFVGLKMLDDLYHHKVKNLETDWSTDSFAPIPAFVDTGSSLVDKSNVDAFIAASKSLTSSGQ
jgi:ribose transport system substrate-binding protein